MRAGLVFLPSWLEGRVVRPLSPYGSAVASVCVTSHMPWASTPMGWSTASLVLRYGRLRLLHQLPLVFLGLVLGRDPIELPIAILSATFGVTQRGLLSC